MADYRFSKTEGAPMDASKAKEWMDRYRQRHPEKETIISRFIGTDLFEKILHQDECVGIRVFFGYNEKFELEIFLVGARADGSNIWPDEMEGKDGPPGAIIGDSSLPCPPYC